MQHDSPLDVPRPLADLSVRLEPEPPAHALPETTPNSTLITRPAIADPVYSRQRQEIIRNRVMARCMAGPDPVIHFTRPPQMVPPEDEYAPSGADSPSRILLRRLIPRRGASPQACALKAFKR